MGTILEDARQEEKQKAIARAKGRCECELEGHGHRHVCRKKFKDKKGEATLFVVLKEGWPKSTADAEGFMVVCPPCYSRIAAAE